MFNFDSHIPSITVDQLKSAIDRKDEFILLDVRTPDEFSRGKIQGSINIPVDQITSETEKLVPDKNKTIYVYCLSGSRSNVAVRNLVNLGYQNVFNIQSGLLAWRANQYPLES